MSALAVVAERHDLMRKLLPNLNNGAASGCHEVRLFLDGRWTAVLVDDWLPTTEKQRRPDGTGLAYARCTGKQLWVSFIEKVPCRLRSPTFFRFSFSFVARGNCLTNPLERHPNSHPVGRNMRYPETSGHSSSI